MINLASREAVGSTEFGSQIIDPAKAINRRNLVVARCDAKCGCGRENGDKHCVVTFENGRRRTKCGCGRLDRGRGARLCSFRCGYDPIYCQNRVEGAAAQTERARLAGTVVSTDGALLVGANSTMNLHNILNTSNKVDMSGVRSDGDGCEDGDVRDLLEDESSSQKSDEDGNKSDNSDGSETGALSDSNED